MTLLILKLFISIAIVCFLYFLYWRKTKAKPRYEAKVTFADQNNKPQAARNLQIKLLRLLHNDRHTANRLIALAKARNPDKSIDWWVEKVIFDLERDRGGY